MPPAVGIAADNFYATVPVRLVGAPARQTAAVEKNR